MFAERKIVEQSPARVYLRRMWPLGQARRREKKLMSHRFM
jgi:hypothetical protein